MAWKEIPNEIVRDFRGLPLKHIRLDVNGEAVYKSFRCPSETCDIKFTNVGTYKDHWRDEHPDEPEPDLSVTAERDESTVGDIVMELLLALHNPSRQNPLSAIQKTNDGHHSTEVWRRIQLAADRKGAIKLKDAQYDWLTQLLDRRLPVAKADKEAGQEQKTVATLLWGLSDDRVQQALKIPSERRKPEAEDDEAA